MQVSVVGDAGTGVACDVVCTGVLVDVAGPITGTLNGKKVGRFACGVDRILGVGDGVGEFDIDSQCGGGLLE